MLAADPKNYSIKALWNGEQIELVDKRDMIKQMDLKQRAEEIRDLFSNFLYELYDKGLIARNSHQYEVGEKLLQEYAPRKKECVKHEPDFTQLAIDEKYNLDRSIKCKRCGVELQAIWSEKK